MIKYLTISIVCLLHCFMSSAQEIKVDSFVIDIKDSIDITPAKYDNNGNICATIKIVAQNISGELGFKGNVIDKIVSDNSSYLVYVMDNTKRLTLYHADYIPTTIEFPKLTKTNSGVRGGHTYFLLLNGNTKMQSSSNVYCKGSRILSFSSATQIVRLVVNGEDWTISNNSSKKLLPYGNYNYEAFAENNCVVRGTVELNPSIGGKNVKIVFSGGSDK